MPHVNKRMLVAAGVLLAVITIAYNLWNMKRSGITSTTFFQDVNGPGLESLALGLGVAFVALAMS